MPKGSIHERLAWGIKKSEMENQQRNWSTDARILELVKFKDILICRIIK